MPLPSMRRDGFVVLRGFLSSLDVIHLRDIFDRLGKAGVQRSRQILYTHQVPREGRPDMTSLMEQWLNPHRRAAPFSTLSHAESIRNRVETATGISTAVLFQDLLMEKRPSHSTFPWHQDFPFWPVDRPRGAVVWAALDPVDSDAGGLRLARQSHDSGIAPVIDLHTGLPQCPTETIAFRASAFEIESPELAPGDAVLFHPLTWHMSSINSAGSRRRVWASTWLDAEVRWRVERAPLHPLAAVVENGSLVRDFERSPTP